MRVLRDRASVTRSTERGGSLIERSRGSTVAAYGDLALPVLAAKRRCRCAAVPVEPRGFFGGSLGT
jgi:hypothetical protein